MSKQIQEIITSSFGGLFGDVSTLFPEDNIMSLDPDVPENAIDTNVRDYYLKPGYKKYYDDIHKQDVDLDGKVSYEEISGLLKKKDGLPSSDFMHHFQGDRPSPGKSFFQTVITTSIKKPDGLSSCGGETLGERRRSSAARWRGKHPRLYEPEHFRSKTTPPPTAQAAPCRAPARAVTQKLPYAKATAGLTPPPPRTSKP
ncbi:hypothetical protein EVAR_8493_1 [Eumeta japonica]|uniref:EF-hand domain-containing protein n=1 Tax=Eumeta variegata TaxID=151549 RepID=A0A4C1XNH6_EUMVA|nr:hypothetical protein EVAR_8493_1 [Eumeta japonica]